MFVTGFCKYITIKKYYKSFVKSTKYLIIFKKYSVFSISRKTANMDSLFQKDHSDIHLLLVRQTDSTFQNMHTLLS